MRFFFPCLLLFQTLAFATGLGVDSPNVTSALFFLNSSQNPDGGFGVNTTADSSLAASSWVLMAVSSLDSNASGYINYSALLNYTRNESFYLNNSSSATDYAMPILSLLYAGEDPCNVSGKNLVSELESLFNLSGNGGYEATLNQDMWALLALVSAESNNSTIRGALVERLKNAQQASGAWDSTGFGDNTDDTAAAVMALWLGNDSSAEIEDGLAFLFSQQNDKGGFPWSSVWGNDTSVNSNAWAGQALILSGYDLERTRENENVLTSSLLQQNPDGSFGFFNTVYTTAQILPTLCGRLYFPVDESILFRPGFDASNVSVFEPVVLNISFFGNNTSLKVYDNERLLYDNTSLGSGEIVFYPEFYYGNHTLLVSLEGDDTALGNNQYSTTFFANTSLDFSAHHPVVEKILEYLNSTQEPDGGWGSITRTEKVLLALRLLNLSADYFEKNGNSGMDFVKANLSSTNLSLDSSATTKLAYTIIALNRLGHDPSDFGGRNLVSELLSSRLVNGSYGNDVAKTTWSILALSGHDSSINQTSSVKWLEEQQLNDNGWEDLAWSTNSSADYTSMALWALVNSRGDLDETVFLSGYDKLFSFYKNQGAVWDLSWNTKNSNSEQYFLQTVLFMGDSPRYWETVIKDMLSYQDYDGSFRYDKEWASSDPVGTSAEAVFALTNDLFFNTSFEPSDLYVEKATANEASKKKQTNITTVVFNKFDREEKNVSICLFLNDEHVENKTMSIQNNHSVSFQYTPKDYGTYSFTIHVDCGQKIGESHEFNNKALVSFELSKPKSSSKKSASSGSSSSSKKQVEEIIEKTKKDSEEIREKIYRVPPEIREVLFSQDFLEKLGNATKDLENASLQQSTSEANSLAHKAAYSLILLNDSMSGFSFRSEKKNFFSEKNGSYGENKTVVQKNVEEKTLRLFFENTTVTFVEKSVRNTGLEEEKITVIEKIPKTVAEDASQLHLSEGAEVLEKDPVIKWEMVLKAGDAANYSWWVEKNVSETGQTTILKEKQQNQTQDFYTKTETNDTKTTTQAMVTNTQTIESFGVEIREAGLRNILLLAAAFTLLIVIVAFFANKKDFL